MDIHLVPFEQALKVVIDNHVVEVVAFKTPEHGNIKFGVNAPRSLKVHREEVYEAIRKKEQESQEEESIAD